MNPHKELMDVDKLKGRERQLAALKSAESLLEEACFRIHGSGLLLSAGAGLAHDVPAMLSLMEARKHLRDAWDRVSALAATAEGHRT